MLLGTALASTQLLLVSGANRALGLSDKLFVLGDSALLTALGEVSDACCVTGQERSGNRQAGTCEP
jgi:hypothetical protein